MATSIRPEISSRNRYRLERHRYYELKHFCLQYPIWKQTYTALDSLSRRPCDSTVFVHTGQLKSDPTEKCAESRLWFSERMNLVERTAVLADPDLAPYLLRAVTEGLSYDVLNARYGVPCCREVYYDRYRRFFWLLSKERE